MRARAADLEGHVEVEGVSVHYEVHGEGPTTILLLPTWTIVHKRFWKAQLAYLARHFRVVTYDGPGNGRSDRPTDPAAYEQHAQTAYALAVLEATATTSAVVVALSRAANWALDLAGNHAERVLGSVFVGPALAIATDNAHRATRSVFDGPRPRVEPSRVPLAGQDPPEHWRKFNAEYWLAHHEDFLWFFFGQCFSEPRSTKQIEDAVAWGLESDPEVLVAEWSARRPGPATVHAWCERVAAPVLVIHGTEDRIRPFAAGEELAKRTGGELLALEGGGHIPLGRDPVVVNLALRDFAERCAPPPPRPRTWTRSRHRARRVLYISSPIGLGHARRDLAVARALREHHPDLEIDWLAQDPVTRVLDHAGERVHPASRHLANESAHIEDESGEHDLHCFQALRDMDEILVANFMVFHDLVTSERYDLVIGDESWDVDYYLHENPELKRFAYAWFTDFVGMLPMGGDHGPFAGSHDADAREAVVAADVNAQMIEHIARFPYVRDRAIFVGNPDDVVDERFGPDLPLIRDWTRDNYHFAGYVTGFDPATLADRAALRAELGYADDEQVCVVTVGGSGVGGDLLDRVVDAFDEAKARLPALRMVAVAGPRLEAGRLPTREGLEIHGYVPGLHRHLAASDLAVVQGGLTTCMELTATGRPFVYVPLRHHFEQNIHVAHRLSRYGAGRRLDYEDASSERLAEVIADEIGREVDYRPVEADGARRAAALLAEML